MNSGMCCHDGGPIRQNCGRGGLRLLAAEVLGSGAKVAAAVQAASAVFGALRPQAHSSRPSLNVQGEANPVLIALVFSFSLVTFPLKWSAKKVPFF